MTRRRVCIDFAIGLDRNLPQICGHCAAFSPSPVASTASALINGIAFDQAPHAFADPQHVITRDDGHSQTEERFCCFVALLLWSGGRWCAHGAVHLPWRGHSNHWRRLLAQSKGDL